MITQGTTLTFKTILTDDYVNEEWKPIEDFDDYLVSNMGRVKHLAHTTNDRNYKDVILTPRKIRGGYMIVRLIKNEYQKDYYVHRLVARAFCTNPYNFNEINHKDEDKTNNRSENLEWCNRYYNNNYGTRKQKVSQSLKKPVSQFTLDGEFIKRWNSAIDVEEELSISRQSIYNCCKGKQQTAGKYKWRYSIEKNVA